MRTRRVWNEHAYHVTNVNEDGTIPKHELPNWTQPGLDNFRQNKQPGSEFAAPDAIVSLAPDCGPTLRRSSRRSRTSARRRSPRASPSASTSGTPGSGTKLGTGATTKILYPPQSEAVILPLPNPPPGVREGTTPVYAIVDDTATPHPSWHECRTDNDTGTGNGLCNQVK